MKKRIGIIGGLMESNQTFTLDDIFDEEADLRVLNKEKGSSEDRLENLIQMANEYFKDRDLLKNILEELQFTVYQNGASKEYTFQDFKLEFLYGHLPNQNAPLNGLSYRLENEIVPASIGLVALEEFFDQPRFVKIDVKEIIPAKLKEKIVFPEVVHTTIKVGEQEKSVPEGQILWVRDLISDCSFIIAYKTGMNGVSILIESCNEERNKARSLFVEVRDYVNTSPYFRGKILELSPSGFQIVTLKDPPMPILEAAVSEEIVKNVHNIFQKKDKFDGYGLPTRRSIILAGPPGTGKTLICRSIAHSVMGSVTTVWVTSKAIRNANHIAEIFSMARKLSPCFLVFEDVDLISGSRESDGETLGEMLNQLDGLKANESLVVIATTNRVQSLDEALKDRPGRFDRIFQLGKPSAETAKIIAMNFLLKHGIPNERVENLNLDFFCTGDFSGAQIEEVVKGGLVEAIYRGCEINDMCLKHSYNGLKQQRKWVMGNLD